MSDIENAIRAFIVKNIMLARDESALSFEDPLLEKGIINSFGIVQLVSFLDEKFGVRIPDSEVVPENFQDINSIAGLVKKIQQ